MTYVLVFASAFIFEVSYTLWLRFAVARSPIRAALLSMVTGALSLYAMVETAVLDTFKKMLACSKQLSNTWSNTANDRTS